MNKNAPQSNEIVHQGDRYRLVDTAKDLPKGYKVWNIGRNAPPGYVPFCRPARPQSPNSEGCEIDAKSLFAVPFVEADVIMDTARYGSSPDELIECLHKYEHGRTDNAYIAKRIKNALPAWFRLFYPLPNRYEKACTAYHLKPDDIGGLVKLDKGAKFHDHYIAPGGSKGEEAICLVCDNIIGWYCPKSPDLVCDYCQPSGKYDENSCRYCGRPNKR